MTLLRESNAQLREENKHNFEECQVALWFIICNNNDDETEIDSIHGYYFIITLKYFFLEWLLEIAWSGSKS